MKPLQSMNFERFETPQILKQLNISSRSLAELKGAIATIPNQSILISTLGMQEAKDSSSIENIVTTHDELYQEDALPEISTYVAAKEVKRYCQALAIGYELVRDTGLITTNHLCKVQSELIGSNSGVRSMPGTNLKSSEGRTVYTPPQTHEEIIQMLTELEEFMNCSEKYDVDPLIKMALIHHQFESIHPFYDGNGRTGRILNVLYLVKESLIGIPVLYLSRPLMQSKGDYYRYLQNVRDFDDWEAWVLYMLQAVEISANEANLMVKDIQKAYQYTKHRIRKEQKFYSQDLVNQLFVQPYTTVNNLVVALGLSRVTATKYLDALVETGMLTKVKKGKANYYINKALYVVLTGKVSFEEND